MSHHCRRVMSHKCLCCQCPWPRTYGSDAVVRVLLVHDATTMCSITHIARKANPQPNIQHPAETVSAQLVLRDAPTSANNSQWEQDIASATYSSNPLS